MFATMVSKAIALLVLSHQTSAHMKLAMPVPYGSSSLTTSPLSGPEDYPCQRNNRQDVYDMTKMNEIPVGVPQELAFSGSASHGGGTCQLSVSLDKNPTADSVFKLIQVFEGGCPVSADGNAGSHPFTFTVPKGFPNGDATLAWTWFNRIGNREIYQNCAPIHVTGGSDDRDLYDSLPNHYIINLPTSDCSSVETSDQIIPYPGQYILRADNDGKLANATGPACAASAAAQLKGVKGYKSDIVDNGAAYTGLAGSGGSGTSSIGAGVAQPTSAAGYGGAPSSYNNGQYSAPSTSVTASATPSAAALPETTSAAAAAPTTVSSDSPSQPASYPTLSLTNGAGVSPPSAGTASAYAPVGTGTSSPGSGPSSGNGIICNASHNGQFGVNVNGQTVWRPVADGTTCEQIAAYRKRSLRHASVRRSLQNAGQV